MTVGCKKARVDHDSVVIQMLPTFKATGSNLDPDPKHKKLAVIY